MKPVIQHLGLVLLTLLVTTLAKAAPLTIEEIDRVEQHLACREACQHGPSWEQASCLAACPAAPAGSDKNLDGALDLVDHRLAVLEYWDGGTGTEICYESGKVVPLAACGSADCLAQHTPAECADADADGLKSWQEALIGTSDSGYTQGCQGNVDCGDFDRSCVFVDDVNRRLCMPRVCDGTCTAFHLETIAQDNGELIVRVHFDYAPTPVTVLEMFLSYSLPDLTLLEARPLAALTESDKELTVRHLANGRMRLLVFSPTNSRPIPHEAIAELVFKRTSGSQSTLAFQVGAGQRFAIAPDPGAISQELTVKDRWGRDVQISAANPDGDRLLLYYSFDNPGRPLDVSDAKPGTELCTLVSECNLLNPNSTGEDDQGRTQAELRTMLVKRYDAVQRGVTQTSAAIEGVSGPGVVLDGRSDHLELPITMNDPTSGAYDPGRQGFSLSLWFMQEEDVYSQERILFSHNGTSEETRFGLAVVPGSDDHFDLVWFEGEHDAASTTRLLVARDLESRKWTHLGMTVDANTARAAFFVDGVKTSLTPTITGTPTIQCPGFETAPGSGLRLHEQGDIIGGRAPETIVFARAKNNLFGIEQMDVHGLSHQEILRDPNSTALDPDFSPIVNKIVYASSKSGSYEIWIADADGKNATQVTRNFGDTALGIFARRPKWAPDASAIVFESNTFDVAAGDNTWTRGYHLYYVEYDANSNKVAIPMGSQVVRELDYRQLVLSQIVNDYRLTRGDGHQTHAVWLKGKANGANGELGELLLNTADPSLRDRGVAKLRISKPINALEAEPVVPFTDTEGAAIRLLAAHRRASAGAPVRVRQLLEKSWVRYEPSTRFSVAPSEQNGSLTLDVIYQGESLPDKCWDDNRNNACDDPEDADDNGACNVADCASPEVRDLYVTFDPRFVKPAFAPTGSLAFEPGSWPASHGKDFSVTAAETSEGSFVKLEVTSPINNLPIPAGTVLARLSFTRIAAGASGFAGSERRVREQLYVKTDAAEPVPFVVSGLEEVLSATFSPDGERLVLSAIQGARPVIVTTPDVSGTHAMQKISASPMKVEGMDWTPIERIYPCNWVGAFRDPHSGIYESALRGAVDELKMYSYVRSDKAFASEAERGVERLIKEGRGGQLPSRDVPCTSDLACPSHQLCEQGQCVYRSCDPQDPYSCIDPATNVARGQCTLVPVPAAQGASVGWACSVECSLDAQCFERECLNGPCRFCGQETRSCEECRTVVQDFGDFQIESTEGCPDRNSFACEEGSCVTECYAFDNGDARYLCDAATEYCRQGRCVTFDWSWSDFAPASLAGLGTMKLALENLSETVAISQLYPVAIEAYGMEDYTHPPELLVQGRVSTQGAQVFNGQWFDIGRVVVHNKTSVDATSNPYLLYTGYPATELRLQLINPPYENLNAAATGLRTRDQAGCEDEAWAEGHPEACFRRAPGSLAMLGYEVGFSELASRRACSALGRANCKYIADDQARYLTPGVAGVVVTSLKVRGNSVLGGPVSTNSICSYEGTLEPLEVLAGGRTRHRKIFYGDVALEQSNQKARYFPGHAPSTLREFKDTTGGSWLLLNCNYANRADPTDVAEARVSVPETFYPRLGQAALSEGNVTETRNGCFVTVAGSPVAQPCYEWLDNAPSLDVMNEDKQPFRTLDFDSFTSFGYGNAP